MRAAVLTCIALIVTACTDAPLLPANAIQGDRIPAPLTQTAGDPIRGAQIFAARDQGHCVLCHQVDALDAPFQGNVGPALNLVAARLDAAQIRLRIVDYQRVMDGALMPSYYRTDGFRQVGEPYKNEPVLSAQQVEDLVAYLVTLGAPDDA
jgi:sulfur-oxidizing protein SoxX